MELRVESDGRESGGEAKRVHDSGACYEADRRRSECFSLERLRGREYQETIQQARYTRRRRAS